VGGTAAGPARFWQEITSQHGGAEADSRIEELLHASATRSVREAELITPNVASQADGPVALVQWSQPDSLGFVEFVACPAVKAKFPQAVCWRIDGDSMTPRFRDGDLVITSANCPAVDGHPCVARQSGQIGVNCKIFKEDGDEILLVPVNEMYRIERLPRSNLQWAHRVLYSVRLTGSK
jgi:SOS-response transcriptional repressor LexA